MFTVFIRRLQFYAYHGVPEAERQIGHRYVADIEFQMESTAGDSDSIHDTVDYAKVAGKVEELCRQSQFRTLEALVTHVGTALMHQHPGILRLILTIGKIAPPAPFVSDEVAVQRRFTRDKP